MTNTHRVLMAVVLVVSGFLAGLSASERNHPADHCQEDEAWWWIANDTRGCVVISDLINLQQWTPGEPLPEKGGNR